MPSSLTPLHTTLTKYSSLILLLGILFALGFGVQYSERREEIRQLENSRAVRGIVTRVVVGEQCAYPLSVAPGAERMNKLLEGRTYQVGPGEVCLAIDVYLEPNVPLPVQVAANKELVGPVVAGDHVYVVQSRSWGGSTRDSARVINTRDKDRVLNPGRESLVFCIAGVLLAGLGGWLQFSAARRGRVAEEVQTGTPGGPAAPGDAPGVDGGVDRQVK